MTEWHPGQKKAEGGGVRRELWQIYGVRLQERKGQGDRDNNKTCERWSQGATERKARKEGKEK